MSVVQFVKLEGGWFINVMRILFEGVGCCKNKNYYFEYSEV